MSPAIRPHARNFIPAPVAALAVSVLAVLATAGSLPADLALSSQGQLTAQCPAGYQARDPVELARAFGPVSTERAAQLHRQYGERTCTWRRLPESFTEFSESARARSELGGIMAPGALRAAVAQKAAMSARQKAVANADGSWNEYGQGPQIFKAEFEASSGNDGIYSVNGRVDNFAYDEANKRLFAAVGNGGIWMSTAPGGDLTKLGDNWTNVGDRLPTLVASGVAWTTGGGGTLIALTGEHTQGGNSYIGLGAYWSTDLGQTWNHATGVPDGAFGFEVKVDSAYPNIIYAATGKGLYRSIDAGRNYTNVALPVSADCAGNTTNAKCNFANFVTGLVVKAPGGISSETCDAKGCAVLAAVGYRAGDLPYADGTPQSPGNGLYRSATGEPGSFTKIEAAGPNPLLPVGFAPQDRIGRVEMGAAYGPAQDHNIVYALVQDARLFNGTSGPLLDSDLVPGGQLPIDCSQIPSGTPADGDIAFVCATLSEPVNPTYFNGIYVSTDFGSSWTRMADDAELIGTAAATGSSLATTAALGVGPGIQSWYNEWVAVDPTQADPVTGAPTRIAFGLEEIWTNTLPVPLSGPAQALSPSDFKVIGTYFAGKTCQFLIGNLGDPGTPVCPTSSSQVSLNRTTTHPDQQAGLFIPDGSGGVLLFAGNDGGAYRQRSTSPTTDALSNDKWGDGINNDRYTLMNYGVAVAKDGTVWYGLQDNTSGKILPGSREQIRIWIGDGMWTAVDPDNSNIAYYQTPNLSLNRTTDGGVNTTAIDDFDVGTPQFLSGFQMDASDAQHLIAAGTRVAETLNAATDASWTTVYDLGVEPLSGASFQSRHRALDLVGDYAYVGACGPCNLVSSSNQFQRKLATNVGGSKPANKGTADGWHDASMAGLPNRFIYNIYIDREDPTGKTIYLVQGGYSTARWAGVGQFGDSNGNIQPGKNVWVSKDAGESFSSVQGNLPDVITTAIVKRGNQLIVGTDIGVFISSDLNGSEWAPLGDLPNVPINQMVLKPGDDKQLFAATFGRGIQQFVFPTVGGSSSGGSSSGASSSGGSSSGSSSGLPIGGGGAEVGRFGGGASGSALLAVLALLALLRRKTRLHKLRTPASLSV